MEAGADLVLARTPSGIRLRQGLRRTGKNVANTRIYARLTSARRDQLHRAAIDTRTIVGV